MTTVAIERDCWCGNRELTPFNSEYDLCPACGTLVAQVGLPAGQFQVVDDETDFYGKQYWLKHQQSDLGIPDIHARARNDLTERNLHWLRTLLKYRLPPGSALELGCAHGSFVALLRQAGYDASGVELSPWVVEFGRNTFDAPVLLGPLESLRMSPATLDVVVAMDVLEHLPDPLSTMATCLSLLKPDGILLIQTPQLTEDLSYRDLVEAKAGFLEMLIPKEHIYLFSRRSLVEFFRRLGALHVAFEPAIFSQYDMFAAVSRSALAANSAEQITSALLASSRGRIALAMLDLRERELQLVRELEESRIDRADRGDQIQLLTAMVSDSERDRAARAEQVETLTAMLNEAEADRTARGRQIESLTNLLNESEADRANRARQIETLTAALTESETDRSDRGRQVQSLTLSLTESEADRAARATQLDLLNATIDKLRTESLALTHEIDRLKRALEGAEGERATQARQIEALTRRLKDSEEDRTQHARHVESLVSRLKDSEDDRAQRGRDAESLLKRLQESADNDALRAVQIAALEGSLAATEARLSAHGSQIESLMGQLRQAEENAATDGKHIDILHAALRRMLQRRGLVRMARLLDWPEVEKLSAVIRTRDNRSLGTIAVDLTPLLPGGDNGGAKIFVVQLLQTLARISPTTQFVLLTQASSHEELAALDGPNVRRLLVITNATPRKTLRDRFRSLGRKIRPLIPSGLHAALRGAGKRMTSPAPLMGAGGILRDLNADILFCPFTAPTYFEPGIPTVCTIYDLQYRTYPEFFDPDDVAHREHTFREACRAATELAAISEYSRQSAIAHGNVDPSRIRTIYLRMAQRMSSPVAEVSNVVARLGLVAGRYLIYPANFWKHKNHEMLLTAFGIACRGDFPVDIKLVCTGAPGARQQFLAESAQAMQLGSRVVFPGFLPERELAALMKQSAAVIFPSLYEGFGLPLIEAMAVGVPVGCSNATSLPEVASGAALLFDPRIPQEIAETMLSLVADRTLRNRLIEAGRERAAEFSDVERMAHEYIQIFADSLSKGKLETMMAGVFADGWAGRCLKIQVAPAADNQVLEIEFSAPDWLPQPSLVVQASHDGRKIGRALQLQRGTDGVLSVPVAETGGYYEISIAPTFVPARIGHGSDMRELSAMLRRCGVSRGPGGTVQLFPAENRE